MNVTMVLNVVLTVGAYIYIVVGYQHATRNTVKLLASDDASEWCMKDQASTAVY